MRDTRPAGPDVPFEQLTPQAQQEIQGVHARGQRSWRFYTEQKQEFAWHDALSYYAKAWDAHKRNREASGALRTLAERVLADHPDQAGALAAEMSEASPFLKDYAPVRKVAPADDKRRQMSAKCAVLVISQPRLDSLWKRKLRSAASRAAF